MSTGQQPLIDDLDESQVVEFLRVNPAFFERHPQLLALMKVSHPDSGEAISLIERQVSILREQNRGLERKLKDLIYIARDNEHLSRQLHLFAAELLKVCTLSDLIAVAEDKLRELFKTDFVTLRLLPSLTDDPSLLVSGEGQQSLFEELIEKDKPICGRLNEEQLGFLFQGNADEVQSAAVIALNGVEPLGLLCLGSRDEDTFNPTMGHVFLQQLADLISSAIAVHR